MKLTFIGADHEVTGSATLLHAAGRKILIDCGMEQGRDIYENCDIPVSAADIDALFLTHAHIDHSGKIPALVANGFKGVIYSTLATYELCKIMLLDSAHIQSSEAQWRNRKAKRSSGEEYIPAYTVEDAQNALKLFRPIGYEERTNPFDNIYFTFQDAGHLLGSASILFELEEENEKRTLLFSGDIGNTDRPLINDPKIAKPADYVVIESTYGDRLHGPRPDYLAQLTNIIQKTFDKGGNVVIPCFAVGRTQEILYLLRTIKEKGLIKNHDNFPVYVDSPLGVEATEIYASNLFDYFDKETISLLANGVNPIIFKGLKTAVSSAESVLINNDKTPKVILSASGMCEAGRIRHHLKHNLWRSESTILFVGYQSEGTLGRKLTNGEKQVKLFGENIVVRAKIETLEGISGHADRDMLIGWLKGAGSNVKRVFVNHGQDTVCDNFAQTIKSKLSLNACAPYSGDEFDLIVDEFTKKTSGIKIKELAAKARSIEVLSRLKAVIDRLISLAKNADGRSNKDIAKLTERINAACDEFEK